MTPTNATHETSAATLASLARESTCLQALLDAGYPLDQASRWLDAWAGPDAQRLWAARGTPHLVTRGAEDYTRND